MLSWPFMGDLSNEKVRAYENDGKWYLELSYSANRIDDSNMFVDITIPKIKLPSLSEISFSPMYSYSHTGTPDAFYLEIPSPLIQCEEIGYGVYGQRGAIFTKERYKEQKEMTLSEIEKALGHGVILKEEADR